ncbi:glycosyltransferase [Arcobacter roscoffensis]|uniref:Glycosyltransferase n=1 Tax=Arcobacter roscoffensis TaxID=2961520 RepID=A0ABY5E0E7_9BACT|nr:glycosyltransferase [Arcobacter roscoffensis]UTJ05671.1 glycosyltransferase [Arcobacter roscoffensis]
MRILHTLHWVQFAGTEKVCVDLCNEFSNENEIFLLSSKEIKSYINDKINLIEIDFEKNRYNPIFLYTIAKIIKNVNPDIIHVHNTKELEIMHNAKIFLDNNVPIVGTRHNPVIKKKFALADLGVAVSDETRLYTNAKKNITILNGIPVKEAVDFEKIDKFKIIAVGRLAPVKGFDNLIKALSLVNFDYELTILGEGEQKEELEKLIKELNLEEKVFLKGFVGNVHDYIYNSDLQVISSIEEGLSLALIEAIFYSKVLLASDIANHKEMLGDKLVFDNTVEDLSKKIKSIYENYSDYEKEFKKLKDRKDEFSIEKMASNYMDAYKSLLKV